MDDHDGTRARRDRRGDRGWVDVQRPRVDVREHRRATGAHDGAGARGERERGHDHLVAGFEVKQHRRQLKRRRAGGDKQRAADVERALQPGLAAQAVRPVAARHLRRAEHVLQRGQRARRDVRAIERDRRLRDAGPRHPRTCGRTRSASRAGGATDSASSSTTYSGRPLTCSKMRPQYIAAMPTLARMVPPSTSVSVARLAQPVGALWKKCSTTIASAPSKPSAATDRPATTITPSSTVVWKNSPSSATWKSWRSV